MMRERQSGQGDGNSPVSLHADNHAAVATLSEHATSSAAIKDKVAVHDVGLVQWAAQQLFDNDNVGSSQGLDMIIADFNSEQTAWNLDSRDIPDTKTFTTHHAVPETRIAFPS
jgi:hypothetical protein